MNYTANGSQLSSSESFLVFFSQGIPGPVGKTGPKGKQVMDYTTPHSFETSDIPGQGGKKRMVRIHPLSITVVVQFVENVMHYQEGRTGR